MRWPLSAVILALLLPGIVTMAQEESSAQEETQTVNPDQLRVREASDFVVGLHALNSQVIQALDELPTRRVIVLPFPDSNGRYSPMSNFIREQLVTAIAATRKYQIVHNNELLQIAQENNIPPMELGNSIAYRQVASRYVNESIVAGSITDLQKKVAVMSRVIQGRSGEYAGAALVYIRAEDEVAMLLGERQQPKPIMEPESKPVETVDDQQSGPTETGPDEDQMEPAAAQENPAERKAADTSPIRPPDVSGKSDLAIYRLGRERFTKNQFREAIGYFEQMARKFPESALADNAFYWIGESYYGLKNWQMAYDWFTKVLEEYPYGNKVPSATLKRGYAEEQLGRLDDAIASMEEVLNRFGDSDVADIAKRKLQLLRAEKQ